MTLKIQEFQSNEMWQHNPANDQQGRHTPGTGGGANMKSTDSPSTSGFANARGMAKIMALMAGGGEVGGVRLLSEAGVEAACANPVRNTARNNESTLNRMAPCGDTAFVQVGTLAVSVALPALSG